MNHSLVRLFVLAYERAAARQGTERCTALEKPATLVLLGSDYDGGTKAWVRWEDGSDDIVPGSKVTAASIS